MDWSLHGQQQPTIPRRSNTEPIHATMNPVGDPALMPTREMKDVAAQMNQLHDTVRAVVVRYIGPKMLQYRRLRSRLMRLGAQHRAAVAANSGAQRNTPRPGDTVIDLAGPPNVDLAETAVIDFAETAVVDLAECVVDSNETVMDSTETTVMDSTETAVIGLDRDRRYRPCRDGDGYCRSRRNRGGHRSPGIAWFRLGPR